MGSMLKAISNWLDALVTHVETAGAQAKMAAEDAKPADVVINEMQLAADIRAKKVTTAIDDVLTEYRVQQKEVQRLEDQIAESEQQARTATEAAKKLPEGDPKRQNLMNLARQALAAKAQVQLEMEPLKKVLESSRPAYERALAAADRMGFDKQQIRSTSQALKIESLSDAMRLRIADAAKELEENGTLDEIRQQARRKVDRLTARAEAVEERMAHAPMTPAESEFQLAKLGVDSKVEDELAALMADAPKAPATPAADSAPAAA